MVQREAQQEAQQEAIRSALVNYVEAIKPLGVVSEVIIGVKPGEPAQLFNVVKGGLSRETADDPRYRELRRYGAQLENKLRSIVPIYASSVNPSLLEGFLADATSKGFELRRLPVTVDILPQ